MQQKKLFFIKHNRFFNFTAAKLSKKNEIIERKVENIVYFCIVKHFEILIKVFFRIILSFIYFFPAHVFAQDKMTSQLDSVEISLLTCSPHDEIYSLYGHTAIRYQEKHNGGIDIVFNYGMFNFHAPYFILRFTLGLTDYELGVTSYELFKDEYSYWGCQVVEQVLNLTYQEKEKLIFLLKKNLEPQNKVYRYNYFYNNCTTKARDIIESSINGKIEYLAKKEYQPSYREMIHEHTNSHPWAAFGNDILLGIVADQKTNSRQQEFLPKNLMYDFDHAQIYSPDGYRSLIKERNILIPSGVQITSHPFPLTPTECSIILLLISVCILIIEYRYKKIVRIWDVALMAATGIAGIILFIMLFSQHPATSSNLQILILNPISLFFIPQIWKNKKTYWWNISLLLILLFLLGGIWQHYAEGMYFVALSLLLRFWSHHRKVLKG